MHSDAKCTGAGKNERFTTLYNSISRSPILYRMYTCVAYLSFPSCQSLHALRWVPRFVGDPLFRDKPNGGCFIRVNFLITPQFPIISSLSLDVCHVMPQLH